MLGQALSHSHHHHHGCPRLHQKQGWTTARCVFNEQRYFSNVVVDARSWWCLSLRLDDLAALCMKLYEQSCAVFSEKWSMETQVKKKEQEILNLEAECQDSHGTFKVPKLKKVQRFKMEQEDWSVTMKKCFTVHWNKAEQKFSKLYVFIITVSLKPDIIFKKYIINLMTEYKKAHNELTRYFKFNNCTILQTLYWLKYIISLESLPSLRRLTPGFHHLKHKTS